MGVRWGGAHLDAEGHQGDVGLSSEDEGLVHRESSSLLFRVFSLFSYTLAPGNHLGRNDFLPTLFAEAVWTRKSTGELQRLLCRLRELWGSLMFPG